MHSHARGHAGHSHGHAHSHDNTFLVSKNKNDAGVRITRIGLYSLQPLLPMLSTA
jgi:hypothetical protein